MNLRNLANKRSIIIIPIALFVFLFSARCSDNNNDFKNEILMILLNCQGGTMAFTQGTLRSWTCCRAVNHGTYWEVVGSSGSEAVQLFIGNASVGLHNTSTLISHEYIIFSSGGINFYGVTDSPYVSGSSTINVTTNNSTTIVGTFNGTVYANGGSTNRVITLGTFTAFK